MSTVAYAQTPATAADDARADDIVVTATRSESVLSKVPISVAAITQQQIESRGMRDFSDVARLTPGVNFTQTATGANRVAIRGVSSSAGASTTGVYIDDVPIQVRSVGFSAGTLFPTLFDLDRVEVLRGPQGTLFGAGSQGGTVRFIQPAPNFTEYTGRARVEVATIRGGSQNYEAAAAVGGPIVQDVLAFRVSGNFRRQGGYIDRIAGNIVPPTQIQVPNTATPDPNDTRIETPRETFARYRALGRENALEFDRTGVQYEDSDWTETTAARAALAFKPAESLTITGSVNYQKQYIHDLIGSVYTELTDAQSGEFGIPYFPTGTPQQRPELTPTRVPDYQPGKDKMILPYLSAVWEGDTISVTSSTSWLTRDHEQWTGNSTAYGYGYLRWLAPQPGDKMGYLYTDSQRNFTQEIRIQSGDANSQFRWLVGGFYTNNRQNSFQVAEVNFIANAPSLFGVTANSNPFPGTSAFLNYFGTEIMPNSTVYHVDTTVKEKQKAVFAQIDFKPVEELTLTLGARYANNKLQAIVFQDGGENNLNAPQGRECPTDQPGCTVLGPGQSPWVPQYAIDTLNGNENVFTPKFSISWQADQNNLFYSTVSKGFRPGGAQVRLPGVCDEGLEQLGYVRDGQTYTPTSYGSDTVWSYEVGSKNRLFDGLLTFDGSIYMIKWSKIQTNISVPICAYAFVDNLGKATSKGFDAQITLRPSQQLSLSAAIGYNKTQFDNSTTAFQKGDFVPGAGAPFTMYLSGEYTVPFGEAENEIYVRGDYTYGARPRLVGTFNPNSPTYFPQNVPEPAQSLLNVRVGVRTGGIDLSLFANNMLNFNKPMGITGSAQTPIFSESYLRPRTVGLTGTYRF